MNKAKPIRLLPEKVEPRKKLKDETEQYTLCRRLEEYMEFAIARRSMSDLAFYEDLLNHIERGTE